MLNKYIDIKKNITLATTICLFACQVTSHAHSHDDPDPALLRESVVRYKKELKKHANDPHTHHKLGVAFAKTRQYKKAIKHLEFGPPKYRNNFENTFYLAESYRGINQFAQAIFYYNKALTFEPQDTKTLTALSWSYFRIRYYSEALATSKRTLALHSEHTESSIILARTLLKLNQSQKAQKALTQAYQVASTDMKPYLHSVMGDLYYEKRLYGKSIQFYRKALRKEPMLAGALFGLGKCLIEKGRPKAAVHYMHEALKIRPQYSEIHYQLAKILEQTNPKRSLTHYRAFHGMAHSDPEHLPQVRDAQRKILSLSQRRNL